MTTDVELPRSEWHLYRMMAQRDIRTATELHRRLTAVGLEISSAQVSRLVTDRPKRISLDVLDALMLVLRCTASDLIVATGGGVDTEAQPTAAKARTQEAAPAKEAQRPVRRRAPPREVPPKSAPPSEDITGPKVTPFPRSKPEEEN